MNQSSIQWAILKAAEHRDRDLAERGRNEFAVLAFVAVVILAALLAAGHVMATAPL